MGREWRVEGGSVIVADCDTERESARERER